MALRHSVTLALGSTQTELSNYDSYEINSDLFSVGAPWQFSLWHSASAQSAWHRFVPSILLGDQIVLAIDGAVQLNGTIEEIRVGGSHEHGASIVISGRDMAARAVDWDADPRTRLYKRVLGDALEDLFRPLGIKVVIGANADAAREVQSRVRRGARGSTSAATTASGRHHRKHRRNKVDLSHPRPGEHVWQVMESILRKMGFMAWVAPSANGELAIIVDVPNYEAFPIYSFERRLQENGQVTLDSNILEGWLHAQIRDIPTHVFAYGSSPRGDQKPARHTVGMSRRSVFARPLYNDEGFWWRSGLPGRGDGPEDLAYGAGAAASLLDPGFTSDKDATIAEAATAQSQPTAPRSPVGQLRPFKNESLSNSPLVINPLPPQPRYLHTRRAKNPATGEQEAKHCIAMAMRRFRNYQLTIQGHGQFILGDDDMRIYATNTMSHVFDNLIGIDEDMLLTKVVFKGSRSTGQTTEISLGTKGAVKLEPGEDSA